MALHHLLATVTIPNDTALPKDAVVNTWHYQWDDTHVNVDTIAEMGAELKARLDAFYGAMNSYLSTGLNNPPSLKVYDMNLPEPRVPLYTANMANLTFGTGSMPHEVALCLSFQADIVSGNVPARHKGRVYLGPWGTNGLSTGTGDGLPLSGLITIVVNAADTLFSGRIGSGLVPSVYSQVDDQLRPITKGWVDNAWDTQRRRGKAATARTLFTA